MSRNIEEMQSQTQGLESLQKKVNALLGVGVVLIGLCGYLLYLTLKV